MKRVELISEITMENMKHILPVIRKNEKAMNIIKSKLTTDAAENNNIIIAEIKNIIENANEKHFNNDGFLYTLISVFGEA
jgi:hypothetical protein